jgi:hypothetical protein
LPVASRAGSLPESAAPAGVTATVFTAASPKPKFVLAAAAVVAPVPPFATGTVFSVATDPRPRFVLAPAAVLAPVPPKVMGKMELIVFTVARMSWETLTHLEPVPASTSASDAVISG